MHYGELISYGVYADLRQEVARRFLGFLWWVIEPVMYMAVFYVVFGLGLKQSGPDYVPFLLVGMVVWKWFDGSVRQASISILGNSGLMQQVYVPKSVFGLVQIFVNTFKFFVVLLLLIGFLLVIGKRPSVHWLGLVPLMLVQLVLIVSVGLFLAAVIPFAHDLKQVVDNLLMLMMFMSGIFMDASSLSDTVRNWFELNPMVPVIDGYRRVLLANEWPNWDQLGYALLVAIPFLVVATAVIRRFERHYPKLMY